MKRFAWIALAGAALISACGGVRSPDFESKLEGLQVSPKESTIKLGGTVQFAAQGLFSNPPGAKPATTAADVSDVSYTIDRPELASLSSTGQLRALRRGVVTVTASAKGLSATAKVTVSDVVLTAINIVPADSRQIAAGRTLTYTAMGSFSDGTTGDITAETVNWTSSAPSVATVSPPQGRSTTATGLAPGNNGVTTITASTTNFEGTPLSASTTLTVTPPVLTDLVITPVPASTPQPISIPVGGTQTFAVQGIFSDSPTPRSVPSNPSPVTWTSSNPDRATFAMPVSNTQNVLTARSRDPNAANNNFNITVSAPDGQGNTITASQPIQISIIDAVLQSLTDIVASSGITPLRVSNGAALPLIVRGIFTDGVTRDVSAELIVFSVAPGPAPNGNATVTNSNPNAAPPVMGGVLTGTALGNVTVTATASSATATKSISRAVAVTDPICVVPFVADASTAVGTVTGPCVGCAAADAGNVVTTSLTDFATLTTGTSLTSDSAIRLTVTGPSVTAAPGQKAGFIIAFADGDFDPSTELQISVGSGALMTPEVTSLDNTSDGLLRRLVRVAATGTFTGLTAQINVPATLPLPLPLPIPPLPLPLGNGVDVRVFSACSTALAPVQ